VTQPQSKPPRVLLTAFPDKYTLPAKPGRAGAQVLDAYRQTGFLLGEELALFERAMNLQLRFVAACSKTRGPGAAAMFSIGSASYSHLENACLLMSQGSYVSCPPLVRMALEAAAVQRAVVQDGDESLYDEWFPAAVTQDRDRAALRIDLGHSKAASILAADEELGTLYRLLMDLSMPHFGPALLFAAPETSLQKAPLAFADNTFHLGLAQLVTGWLLQVSAMQATTWLSWATSNDTVPPEQAPQSPVPDIVKAMASPGLCYVERIDDGWVIHNFRRSPSGQPKRIVLGS